MVDAVVVVCVEDDNIVVVALVKDEVDDLVVFADKVEVWLAL